MGIPFLLRLLCLHWGGQVSMSGSGVATTKPGKLKVIEEVTDLLEKSTMVFSVPSSGISVSFVCLVLFRSLGQVRALAEVSNFRRFPTIDLFLPMKVHK